MVMTTIMAAFTGSESKAEMKAALADLLDDYGFDTSAYTFWDNARRDLDRAAWPLVKLPRFARAAQTLDVLNVLRLRVTQRRALLHVSPVFAYDLWEPNSLAQNADGSGVVADGDPVGLLRDCSGLARHLTASGSARPTYRESGGLRWLDFAGSQHMSTSSFAWGASIGSVFVAAEKENADAAEQTLLNFGNVTGTGGSWRIVASTLNGDDPARRTWGVDVRGVSVSRYSGGGIFAAPDIAALCARFATGNNLAGSVATALERNNSSVTLTGTGAPNGGNFGTHVLRLGARWDAAGAFQGKFFGALGVGRGANEREITFGSNWAKALAGL
jgi:hypothetical protein